ncbi:TetR/AcrR family transcriptional regulator [Limosilactobacillus kribbianus]|uniref:TetR/AcrR family transcriptional regulator n=1 Tax=Limosilactobacillus kribbianus TaxID=2982695 RepID=UPI002264C710|nr:TetR/AcrR family transcriptional regulator [Limosilactobacillus kribbianus]
MAAFKQMFTEQPLNTITVTALARRANVNRKTYYQYFYTLTDVLQAIEDELLQEIENVIAKVQPLTIENLTLGLNQLARKNYHFCKALIKNNQNDFFLVRGKDLFKQGLAKRIGADLADPIVDLRLECISAGVTDLYDYWIVNYPELPDKKLVEVLQSVLNEL